MGVALTKDSIDLGIVVADAEQSLAFYRDTLGFDPGGETPMPGGGGVMHRLPCGTSLIKLIHQAKEPPSKTEPSGISGASSSSTWHSRAGPSCTANRGVPTSPHAPPRPTLRPASARRTTACC